MAKVIAPLMSMDASGSVAKAITTPIITEPNKNAINEKRGIMPTAVK